MRLISFLLALAVLAGVAHADEDALTTREGLRSAITKDMYSFFSATMPHPAITNDHKQDAIDVDDAEIGGRGDELARSVGFVNLEEGVYGLQTSLRSMGLIAHETGVTTLHPHAATTSLGQVCAHDVEKFCSYEAGELQFVLVVQCLHSHEHELTRNCAREFTTSLAHKCAVDMATHCHTLHLRTLGDVFAQEVLLADCFDDNHDKLRPQCKAALARAVRPPVVVTTLSLHDKAPSYVDDVGADHPEAVHREALEAAAPVEPVFHPFNPLHALFGDDVGEDAAGGQVLPSADGARAASRGKRVAIFIILVVVAIAAAAALAANCCPQSGLGRAVRGALCRGSSRKGGSFAGRLVVPTSDDQYNDDFTDAHYDL
jgi:hypothetical protein